ncbi:proline-rich receptor-like protein kinase PERK15 [Spinacia oleracea]|uniref:non-specific serine/threonine protein kinase n=1 Tax=Spinacia oleracea TaxID=3562 RepID=A0ABM3R0K1_SPIOL|nr:proline-rich receptor-like protein kinase PERK15 [Spinacia oleracea]
MLKSGCRLWTSKVFFRYRYSFVNLSYGNFCYLVPEYVACGKLTEKSDASPSPTQALEGGRFSDIVDPRLKDYNHFEMAQVISCAAASVLVSARQQPQMTQVVQALPGNLSAKDVVVLVWRVNLLDESPTEEKPYDSISAARIDMSS